MTKVILLGQQSSPEKKKIQIIHAVTIDEGLKTAKFEPREWRNIILLCKKFYNDKDLIFGFDDPLISGVLYLGYWNDGVV